MQWELKWEVKKMLHLKQLVSELAENSGNVLQSLMDWLEFLLPAESARQRWKPIYKILSGLACKFRLSCTLLSCNKSGKI